MSWIAVAIGASAVLGAGASIYAGNEQSKSAQNASNTQMQMFGLQQDALNPYRRGGLGAVKGLQSGLGTGVPGGYDPNAPLMRGFSLQDFQASPSYQFNLAEGQKAIDKAAAARGGGNFYAPQTLQDMSRFSQGLASNEYWNAEGAFERNQASQFNRLYNLTGIGQASAAGVGAGALQTGALVGSNQIGAGNAQAAGIMGASNAITGGIGNAYNAYLLNSVLGQAQGGMAGGGAYPFMGGTGGNAGYGYGLTDIGVAP